VTRLAVGGGGRCGGGQAPPRSRCHETRRRDARTPADELVTRTQRLARLCRRAAGCYLHQCDRRCRGGLVLSLDMRTRGQRARRTAFAIVRPTERADGMTASMRGELRRYNDTQRARVGRKCGMKGKCDKGSKHAAPTQGEVSHHPDFVVISSTDTSAPHHLREQCTEGRRRRQLASRLSKSGGSSVILRAAQLPLTNPEGDSHEIHTDDMWRAGWPTDTGRARTLSEPIRPTWSHGEGGGPEERTGLEPPRRRRRAV